MIATLFIMYCACGTDTQISLDGSLQDDATSTADSGSAPDANLDLCGNGTLDPSEECDSALDPSCDSRCTGGKVCRASSDCVSQQCASNCGDCQPRKDCCRTDCEERRSTCQIGCQPTPQQIQACAVACQNQQCAQACQEPSPQCLEGCDTAAGNCSGDCQFVAALCEVVCDESVCLSCTDVEQSCQDACEPSEGQSQDCQDDCDAAQNSFGECNGQCVQNEIDCLGSCQADVLCEEICTSAGTICPDGCPLPPSETCSTDCTEPEMDCLVACDGTCTVPGEDYVCHGPYDACPVDCDDGNPCTEDLCNPVLGECSHDTTPLDGEACSDANACTGPDICTAGTCAGEEIDLSCDDGVACTIDACVPNSGICGFDTSACLAPQISAVTWTFASPCPATPYEVTIQIDTIDLDTPDEDLTYSGFLTRCGPLSSSPAVLTCAAFGGLTGFVKVSDPQGGTDTVSVASLAPCVDGSAPL